MFNTVCVTARSMCGDFLGTIEKICKSRAQFIILREKELDEAQYLKLAESVYKICRKKGKRLVIHKYASVARALGIRELHLPFSDFVNFKNDGYFKTTGTSVHSVDEAAAAEKMGASYITAGHIFSTDCKKGLEPRGIDFLDEVCKSVSIPVYAIGGINASTVGQLAAIKSPSFCGACIMSGFMQCDNPSRLIDKTEAEYFTQKKNIKSRLLLYAVTDRHWLNGRELEQDVEKALRGGATMLQLREKNIDEESYIKTAKKIHAICLKYNVPLIINDSVRVCLESGAEGVHLGQNDIDTAQARKILGREKIIGATARTAEQALKAEKSGADYIGSGAVFGTSTKSDAVKMSLQTLDSICRAVTIPVVAIGGISAENILNLKGTKISGAAVVSGIFAAEDIEGSAKNLKRLAREAVNGAGL